MQAQALLSMLEDFNASKSKDTIVKNVSTFLQEAANNEAVARRQGEEEDKWQPGERSQFFILDPEGQKSGIFSEEIDDLLDKDGNKRMIKEMLRAVFPTSSLLNLEKAVDKLVDVYEAEAGNLEKKPNGGPHVVKMVAALYKEVAGSEKWFAHVNRTCTQIQNNNGITAKVAFDLVIKESKRALLVKAGTMRAVAQDSWNPDAAKLMRLLAAGEGADGGGARGRGKGEEGREDRERADDRRRAEGDRLENRRRDDLDRRERAEDKRREDAGNSTRREEDRRRKEADERVVDRKQAGNGMW